jgi:hypothetical protein
MAQFLQRDHERKSASASVSAPTGLLLTTWDIIRLLLLFLLSLVLFVFMAAPA